MKIKKVLGARTAQPNTAFTDSQQFVLHIVDVIYEDDTQDELKISAECPVDAMKKIYVRMKYQ